MAALPSVAAEKIGSETAHDELKGDMVGKATIAAKNEKSMTLGQAIKKYPRAILWSVMLSTTLVMEGYDLALLNNLYASDAFQSKYGSPTADGGYAIRASWQSALSNGARAGEVIGLYFNGLATDRFGYRWTMMASLVIMFGTIFILFFAQNIQTLLAVYVLCGLPWGAFQTMTTAYASDVSPVHLRPYLTTYVNLCWVMGQFIAAGVTRGSVQRGDEWAYRIPYAIQWIWPVPLLIGTYFAPESPWWLVRRGKIDQARASLNRLLTAGDDKADTVEETLNMIKMTNDLEAEMSSGTSYLDCYRGIDLRRTEIICGLWLVQSLCGSNIMGYSTYFMRQAGLPTIQSFNMTLVQYATGVIGTILSWFLMMKAGRRKIYVIGTISLWTTLMIVGFLGIAPSDNTGAQWAIGAMLIVFTFVFDFSVGPVCYSLVAEMSSTRLKAKTIVLGRMLYNTSNCVVNVLTNYQLNPTAWNWSAKTAFFWGGTCFLCATWAYFRVPEPTGRTYAELDILFENKISARKFASVEVDMVSHRVVQRNRQEDD